MSFKKNTPGSFYIWQRIIHTGKQTPGIRLMVALNLKFTKRKNKITWGCRTNVRQLILYIQHKTPSFEKPGVRGIISLCD